MVSLVLALGVQLEAWRGQKMDQQVVQPFPTGKEAAQSLPFPACYSPSGGEPGPAIR